MSPLGLGAAMDIRLKSSGCQWDVHGQVFCLSSMRKLDSPRCGGGDPIEDGAEGTGPLVTHSDPPSVPGQQDLLRRALSL